MKQIVIKVYLCPIMYITGKSDLSLIDCDDLQAELIFFGGGSVDPDRNMPYRPHEGVSRYAHPGY